jgi:hypothetical protein
VNGIVGSTLVVSRTDSIGHPAFTVDVPTSVGTPAPNWLGTNVDALWYPALGSVWVPGTGIGLMVGDQLASTVAWIYGPFNHSAFQVRALTDSTPGRSPIDPQFSSPVITAVWRDGARLGIGTDAPHATLDVNGTTSTKVLTITGADVAEPFDLSPIVGEPKAIPGMVVSIDPSFPGKLALASHEYDSKVAGVISGANGLDAGIIMGKDTSNPIIRGNYPIAMSGRVWVWCDASAGPIQPGDLLTSSHTLGHAMKASDRSRAFGAVVGKAMTALNDGKGLVLVLVNLQ